MQRQSFVSDTYFFRTQTDILHRSSGFPRKRKVLFQQSLLFIRSDDVIFVQTSQRNEPAIVHDTLKLCNGFHKTVYGFFIPDFFRDKRTFTKRTEVALHTHPLFGSLRKEQVAIMVQKRSLV